MLPSHCVVPVIHSFLCDSPYCWLGMMHRYTWLFCTILQVRCFQSEYRLSWFHRYDLSSSPELYSLVSSTYISSSCKIFSGHDNKASCRRSASPFDFTHCFYSIPSYPIDPALYKKLRGNKHGMSESVGEMESYRSESEEKLLFDCINEVLLEILGPFFNPRPWVKPTKWKHQQHMPVGNWLLEVMWRKISYYLYQQSDTGSDPLVLVCSVGTKSESTSRMALTRNRIRW